MDWRAVRGQIALIVVIFILLIIVSKSGLEFEKPAVWLNEWIRLLGTVITIVAGLKAAWSVPKLLQALINERQAAPNRRLGE